MLSLILWAYKNIYRALSLAFLKSIMIVIFFALAAAYTRCWLPVTLISTAHIHLRDCIHLLFLVLHLKSNLRQDYLFISDFYCSSQNEVIFCDWNSNTQQAECWTNGETARKRQNDLPKISCDGTIHLPGFASLFYQLFILLVTEEVQAF